MPVNICSFLVFKDAKAKTQPHNNGCPHTDKKGLFPARPRRLTYSTVDSYIGKLHSIFAEAGRQGDWNRTLLLGNPATDNLVKIYLKSLPSRPFHFFLISFCCSLTTSRGGLLCLPLTPQNSLLPLVTRPFSSLYSTLVTGQGFLARWKRLKLHASR